MDWNDRLTEEQSVVLEQLGKFLEETVAPNWFEIEQRGEFPHAIVSECKKLGLFGLSIPESYGGSGVDAQTCALIARLISYHWPALFLIITANSSLAAFPILYAGTEKQKKKYLPALSKGDMLGCFALTEPDVGSDVSGIKTRATKVKGGWNIKGSKHFITNAEQAHICIMFARTGEGPHDISAFIVCDEMPLKIYPSMIIQKQEKWAQRGSDMCLVSFTNEEGIFVPNEALLGEENGGFKIAMETLNRGRINIAAQALGNAAWVLDYVWNYAKERRAFGGPLADKQYVQFKCAEGYGKLVSLWGSVVDAARDADEGVLSREKAASVKLSATEGAWDVVSSLSRFAGGMFIDRSCPVASRFLEAYIMTIYEGASEVQMMMLAKALSR